MIIKLKSQILIKQSYLISSTAHLKFTIDQSKFNIIQSIKYLISK